MDQLARDAAVLYDPVPALAAQIVGKCLEPLRVVLDEVVREDSAARALVLLQHLLHDALEQREIAVNAYGEEQAGQLGAAPQHVERLLRVLASHQPPLDQRVHAAALAPVARPLLELGEHARVTGPGFWPMMHMA